MDEKIHHYQELQLEFNKALNHTRLNISSWLALVVVHRHVFLPIVREDLSWQALLLLIGQIESVLLFEELGVLLLVAQPHVVSICLGVALGEPETPQDGLGLFEDSLDFVRPALLHLHEVLLKGLLEAHAGHLLNDRFASHVLNKTRLKSYFINDALERIWFVIGEVGEEFAIDLDV